MGSCAAPSAKGDDKFITTDYLQQCLDIHSAFSQHLLQLTVTDAVFAVPAYGPQNDVTLKMPAFEWVHVQLHQQKGMISLSPPTICNSAA
ncbi:hypothetical protein FR848_29585 (plasmid) [Klebsiella michiganensis]|nr:hypothetical protein FR848_29585 [Klebsiella michiganensis]